MSGTSVTVVRVYLHEGGGHVQEVLDYLHDEAKVRGVTVFRGISGYGSSGRIHTSSLVDLSLDLPVVVEFYEDPARVEPVVRRLNGMLKAGHVVHWPATFSG